MRGDNTARRFYLLVNTNEPARPSTPTAKRHPSGLGLLSAFVVAIVLWAGLISLGAMAVAAISR